MQNQPRKMFRIKFILILLLTTFISLRGNNKGSDILVDQATTVPNYVVDPKNTDQVLDKYNFTIKQVIVKGTELSSLIETLQKPVIPQEKLLMHVDSIYNDFKSTILCEVDNRVKESYNNKRRKVPVLPSILVVWLGLLVLSVKADWEVCTKIFTYLLCITFAFCLYNLSYLL